MSWVPINNDPNDHGHSFLDDDEDGFSLIFEPLFNTQNTNESNNNNIRACFNQSSEIPEIPNTCFNYITELLKDDNPNDQPVLGSLQDYMAYQSYYQSLTDTLSSTNPNPNQLNSIPSSSTNHSNHQLPPQQQDMAATAFCCSSNSSHGSNSLGAAEDFFLENQSNLTHPCSLETSLSQFPLLQQALFHANTSNIQSDLAAIRIRKHLDEDRANVEERQTKQSLVAGPETYDQISEYEENIFCPEGGKYDMQDPSVSSSSSKSKPKKKYQKGGRKAKPEVVDLMTLLINCAESVSRMDISTAREQMSFIRKHTCPSGDNLQRVSHYLVNALDQRLSSSSSSSPSETPSATEFLRASRIYVAAAPFNIMSYYVCNKTICNLAGNSSSVHIIDFGIGYGLQWPCIIYNISKVEPTPPRVRITGIDFPESGFRPSHRVDETGRCLKKYSERFKVELEYKAIVAERWECVTMEEIGIRGDDFTVVNSLYRSQQVYDESVEEGSSPRDAFLELVRKIRPECFVHGVVSGNLNAPFFIMRFKEVVSHYSALFEVFEATMPREDPDRAVLEKLFGDTLRNVVACEGRERLERPDTYRRWQARKMRLGFRQVPLEKDLFKRAKAMVQTSFRKEFIMEEDSGWAVQGWKGRIFYAVSCWRPQH